MNEWPNCLQLLHCHSQSINQTSNNYHVSFRLAVSFCYIISSSAAYESSGHWSGEGAIALPNPAKQYGEFGGKQEQKSDREQKSGEINQYRHTPVFTAS